MARTVITEERQRRDLVAWLVVESRTGELIAGPLEISNGLVVGKPGSREEVSRDREVVEIDDPTISTPHVGFVWSTQGAAAQYLLRDLGSANGTRVNDDPIVEHQLQDGDRIGIGESTLIYRCCVLPALADR